MRLHDTMSKTGLSSSSEVCVHSHFIIRATLHIGVLCDLAYTSIITTNKDKNMKRGKGEGETVETRTREIYKL